MKKSLTRALSLVLVLVMMLGVLPMASADGTTDVIPENRKPAVTMTAKTAEATWNSDYSTATVTLTATFNDGHGYDESALDWEVTEKPTGATASAENGNFTANKAGSYTVTASVTYTPNEYADPAEDFPKVTKTDTCTVTVPESGLVTATAAAVSVKVGTKAKIAVAYNPADKAPAEPKYAFSSQNTSIAEVNAETGEVTGKKVGETKVNITISNYGDVQLRSTTITCDVKVNAGTISVSNKEVALGTNGNTLLLSSLNPVYDADGDNDNDNDQVIFKYDLYSASAKTGDVSLNAEKTALSATKPGAAKVVVSAYEKDETTKPLASTNVYVSFYQSNTVEVTMPSGKTTLTFGSISDIKETGNLSSLILKGYDALLAENIANYVTFSGLSRTEGTLDVTGNSIAAASLGNVKFTVGTSGKAVFDAKVTAANYGDLALCKAAITIKYDGELGDIEYSTTYNKAITFDEADFAKFWKASGQTSALNYVSFSLLTYPAYGDLYLTATSTTTANKAQSSHQFYYDYNSRTDAGTYNKDLDTLTYVPEKSITKTYDVTIPFTAYGEDTKESVSGMVVIHMNPNDNNITSRGVFFGTTYDNKGTSTTADDLTYADQLAEIYKTATGKELGYVVFTLPAAERATLYSRVPVSGKNYQIARGTTLLRGTKLYYHGTSSVAADLDDVALIPAAGFSGPLTLSFTGYDAAGNNEKDCTITFNVQTKTASAVFSDVTAKGYSWAADSVDFLYYEGTAQGSNGKYNPASNITRRDFMLMLYRAFLEEDYGTYNVSSNFPDVIKGSDDYSKEIYQAVGVAKYLGIAQGTNNKFNPTSNITRQEAMVLIYRTLEVINKDLRTSSGIKATSFKDYSKIGSWATAAISSLVSHGVIQGTNDYINPLSNITRAEMACILHRVITY